MKRALAAGAKLGSVVTTWLASVALLLAGCGDTQPGAKPPDLPPWVSVTINTAAPPPPPAPEWQPAAEVNVTNFMACGCGGHQAEVKVKLALKNVSPTPLNISIQNIRLLTDNFDRTQWDPDIPTPNEPSTVTVGDRSFTAVPANTNRAYKTYNEGGRQVATWASHWYGGTLDPGQPYQITDRGAGHVVFNLPLVGGDKVNISGIGLVTNDGATLLGWSPIKDWPSEQTDPSNF